MTDVLTPAEAGWYPDPSGTADRRFWDGDAWTEHTRGHAHPHPPTHAPQVHATTLRAQPLQARPVPGQPDAAASTDGAATASLVLGIVSLFVNLLLAPSVVGIVLGVKVLRAGGASHGKALAGVILSCAGVLAALVQAGIVAAIAIPTFLALQHGAVVQHVEAGIQSQAGQQGVPVLFVNCDVPASVSAGSTMACVLTTTTRMQMNLQVHFTDDRGDYTWTRVG